MKKLWSIGGLFGLTIIVALIITGLSTKEVKAVTQQKSTALIMDHKKHASLGITCENCHTLREESEGLMGFPDHTTCSSCHNTEEAGTCKMCHRRENFQTGLRKERIFAGTRFSHDTHAAKEIACLVCHEQAPFSRLFHGNEGLPTMENCIDCHAKRNVSSKKDCEFCHPKEMANQKPSSHTAWWNKTHGEEARGLRHNFGQYAHGNANTCETCHRAGLAGTCMDCHQKEAPASHTLSFKVKGHSLEASRNRNSCAVCHDQSACMDCHRTTKPFSHTGVYGKPLNRHCNNCHLSGGTWSGITATKSNCAFCHDLARANQKHAGAPKMPSFGHASSNCTECHVKAAGGAIPAMRHPGSGGDSTCLACHQ